MRPAVRGRSGDTHQRIDGNAFRMRVERGKLVQQADAISFRFTETDDPATANGDSGFSHGCESAQAVVVISGGDDLPVKFGRSVEVVIVSRQPCFGQAAGLGIVEHAQRAANFHAKLGHTANHFQDIFKILAFLHLPPCSTHAETGRPFAAGTAGMFHNIMQG